MPIHNLLVANRGEIAVRVLRAAAELGMHTVAVYAQDDADALHTRRADEAICLGGTGVAAYMDVDAILAAAKQAGCDAIHPGYGFLSENAAFAQACVEAGIRFVGPRPQHLQLFGDKSQARAAATEHGLPVLEGTAGATTLPQALAFFRAQGGRPMLVKAVAGGGGRGIRVVRAEAELEDAFARCASEALSGFGDATLFVESMMERARHVEVQVVGDGRETIHLWERECSIQRRRQKLIEIAPAPGLSAKLRDEVLAAAVRFAAGVGYENIGTFEFLVDEEAGSFAFMEANPRLQVEHTVTEAVTGVDLVRTQLRIAGGESLADLGLGSASTAHPRGYAIQLRVNAETMNAEGEAFPSGGKLGIFEVPSGPGVRTDTFGYAGYTINPRYDSLLAKVIVHGPSDDFTDAVVRAKRALAEFHIEGVETNLGLLQGLLDEPDLRAGKVHTRWLDEQLSTRLKPLLEVSGAASSRMYFEGKADAGFTAGGGAEIVPEGTTPVRAQMQALVVDVAVKAGDAVRAGQTLLIIEAMKLEYEVAAPCNGVVHSVTVAAADVVSRDMALVFIEEGDVSDMAGPDGAAEAETGIRPNLQALLDRRAKVYDEARPDAVARQHARGERTARENVYDLCDRESFIEYGALALATQRHRRPLQDLIDRTPADGIITGIGAVNADLFAEPVSSCAILAYDYTVLAGTQGRNSHRKTDRLVDIAERSHLPVIFFTQGGGGRPGDGGTTDAIEPPTFNAFPRLSGLVPIIGINSGPCFAGNAGILACCDVIIATRNSNIGWGGPAMIEGGGLGVFATEEVGPIDVMTRSGVVDIAVEDEAEAVRVAKKYLSYFQGPVSAWTSHDQTAMRTVLPASRLRGYEIRNVIELLADQDSVLELRNAFGVGIVTAFIRVEGRPLGVIANNPMHLGGAIDAEGADKAVRFMQLCDAFDIPLISLVDTPGMMVGPEAEKTGQVRRSGRMFLTGANMTVPLFTVVLRKCYGLGSVSMAAGWFKGPMYSVAWPSAEFGGMGIEASVKLAYRREMGAMQSDEERKRFYDEKVAESYETGGAINMASVFWYDDAIDPAETRRWIGGLLRTLRPPPPRQGKKRPAIDA
jgi:acetyl/propionyl-CoA carboxylase alpha subunit/acetyl-CoA carboxylase carboxyltransferase component